jgi:hypothetical protein
VLISYEGPAPADEVWRRYTEPAAWPGWAPQVSRVDVAKLALSRLVKVD